MEHFLILWGEMSQRSELASNAAAVDFAAAETADVVRCATLVDDHLLRWHAHVHVGVFGKVAADDLLINRRRHTICTSSRKLRAYSSECL